MNREIVAKLRTILAHLYPNEPDIRRIIADAGLDETRIDLNSTALNNWHSVLDEAEKHNQINRLLGIVEQEYTNNQELQTACAAYKRAAEQIDRVWRDKQKSVLADDTELEFTSPDGRAIDQNKKFQKRKFKVGGGLIVALVGVLAIVAASWLLTLFTNKATPTPVTLALPTVMPTTLPTPVPTQVAVITPIPTMQPFATPIIQPWPVRVAIGQFDQCADEDVAFQLSMHMKPYLRKPPIEVKQLQTIINTHGQARSQPETDIVIWGVCTADNKLTFHAELNLFSVQAMGRVAEPETVQITGTRDSLDLTGKILAATVLYAQQASTAESVALLKQTASQWQSTEEISLHWLLGNALLGHSETTFSADAQHEYETIISLWGKPGQGEESQQALIYNNLGMSLAKQKKYPDSIEAFQQAIQANPNYVWPYISRSEVYARIRQKAEAEADCSQVIVLNPVKGYICRTLADIFTQNLDNIVVDAQQANAIDPEDAFVQIVNALSACQQGNTPMAFKHIEIFYQQAFAHLTRWERDHALVATIAAKFVDRYRDGC